MDKLKQFQESFVQSIQSGDVSPNILNSILPSKRLTAEKALQTYREDYTARLTEALGDNYEAVWSVLGDEIFFNLCHEYLKEHTSNSFDLGDLGKDFPEFLSEHKLQQDFPFLVELAHLDQGFLRLFHGSIPETLSAEQIQSIPEPEHKTLTLSPLLDIYDSSYPIYSLWELRNDPQGESDHVDWEKGECFVFYRSVMGLRRRFLTPVQKMVLQQLKQSLPLARALEEVQNNLTIDSQQLSEVSELFQFLVHERLIVALS